MNIKKILIVAKKTKYEFQKYKFLFSKLNEHLENIQEKIYQSHIRQVESEEFLKNNLRLDFKFVKERNQLESFRVSDYDLVLSLGGDNHFIYTSHFCRDTIIVGCNSDEKTSTGSLLYFNPQSFIQTVNENFKNIEIDEWSLIDGVITYPNGKKLNLPSAIGEITVRNSFCDGMSRFCINYENIFEEHRSTGLLIYNGVGSTAWIASYKENTQFSKTADYFYCYSRELRSNQRKYLEHFKIGKDKTLNIFSNTEEAEVCIDCLKEKVFSFPIGSKLELKLSPMKQKILVKK